jgi:hypothetical protein
MTSAKGLSIFPWTEPPVTPAVLPAGIADWVALKRWATRPVDFHAAHLDAIALEVAHPEKITLAFS